METLTSQAVRDLVAERQRAIAVYRESDDAEAQRRAFDEGEEIRKQLDDHMVSLTESREVNDHHTGGVPIETAQAIVGGSASRTSHDDAAVRMLLEPQDGNGPTTRSATISLEGIERRTEYPLAVGDSSHTYGAYAFPTNMQNMVIMSLLDESAVLDARPTIIRTQSGEDLPVPLLTTDATADYRSELAAASQSTPVLGSLTLHAYNLAGFIQTSSEFLSDAVPAARETFVGRLCGRALGIKLATELAIGDGSSHVDGLFNGVTTGATAASTTTYNFDELLALRASITGAARKGARWVFSDDAHAIALSLKDGNANYIIQPAVALGAADTLWGHAVHVDGYGPACTTGKRVVVFGRLEDGYAVRFAGQMEITRSDEAGTDAFVKWISTYRFQVRVDAGFTSTTAVKSLTLA